jgi:HSP20 family protein
MLLQTSPFRDLDSFFDQFTGRGDSFRVAPMDAYRRGDDVWVHIDLPGVAADSIDISVERSVLTIVAERKFQPEEGDTMYYNERFRGTFRRQVSLGDGLDAGAVEADYHDGVLTLRIPVAPQAKPRKIEINAGQQSIDVNSTETANA